MPIAKKKPVNFHWTSIMQINGAKWRFAIAITLVLGFGNPILGAAFSLDQWQLASSVSPGGPPGNSIAVFLAVMNPFVNQHEAQQFSSAAGAAYNYHWTNIEGTLTSNIHATAQGPISSLPFQSGNSALIVITPLTDLQIDLSGNFTYALAPGDRNVHFQLTVEPTDLKYPAVFNQGAGASPIFGDPPSGTFDLGGSVILHPGQSYQLVYTASLISFIGSPTQLSNYNGEVTFQITALPEPATLGVLAVGALFTLRRSRR